MPAPKTPSKAIAAKAGDPNGDAAFVKLLAQIIGETGLSEIEVERGDLKVRVARTVLAAPEVHHFATAAYAPPPPQGQAAATAAPAPAMSSDPAGPAPQAGESVPSPMVGTVYLQATPGADPFIKPGDSVKTGQTLLIIEAMKTMNPIAAPRDGKVLDILVGDAQPVEFGEALLLLE